MDDLDSLEGVGSSGRSSYESSVYEELERQLTEFRDRFGTPESLAYPGSSTDITPSEALPDTDVVYIDKDADAMAHLDSELDAETVVADANNVTLDEQVDAILFYNQDFDGVVEFAERNLGDSGLVICNEYHKAASNFVNQDQYVLDGRFPVQEDQDFDPNAEDCFEQISSDEEFSDLRPEQYQINRKLVDKYVGEGEEVVNNMPEVVERLGEKPMMEAQEESHIRLQMATDMFMRPKQWSPPVKKSRKPDDLFIFHRK